MPSIREVAREAGVSIATVSRVLNGRATVNPELRERVLRVANHCNYVPTVGKRTAERIALLYPGPFAIESPYDSACLDGIVTAMRQTNYDLAILDLNRDRAPQESFAQFLSRKGVGGAIVRSTLEQRDLLQQMSDEGTPMVVLGDHFDHPTIRFCYADSSAASREAVEHLVSLGHRSIAFAACDRDDGDHIDRLEAFRSVTEAAGILREDLIYRVPPARLDGAPLVRRILSKRDRPTALFVADPLVAVGALNEAQHLGVRVPEELSLVAMDDTDTRNMVYPRLSAICQDSKQLGEEAFAAVCQLIDGGDADVPEMRHEAWFEIHDTTAPPPERVERFLPAGRRGAEVE